MEKQKQQALKDDESALEHLTHTPMRSIQYVIFTGADLRHPNVPSNASLSRK